ncbi:MAG TPA: M20/M25/M40 family metallo-hydrolase [Bacteroidia bacterium]|jgi:aminopeptidase YwaD|nr:M20/M25/M40 family metallo-hydrolase [Bacteroidia bacterium]
MIYHFKISCTIVLLFFAGILHAQKDYARKVVDTLASPYMEGRGYVDNGDKKAAKYITGEFKKSGLLPITKTYEQAFSFSVNNFTKPWELNLDGKKLVAGADYIVVPSSPSLKGAFPIVLFDRATYLDKTKLREFLNKDYSNAFVLVDDSGVTEQKEKEVWESTRFNPFKAKGVIILCNKLTQEMSDTVSKHVLIYALRGYFPNRPKSLTINVETEFVKKYTSQNLIGYIKGNVQPDTFIVFSAHYDHLGRMGSIYFPGANDNASGVAMLLSMAKYFAQHKENLKYSVAFIAFSGEEIGLLGSKYYTEHPLFPLNQIKFLVNMDIMGTGDEGITVVNSTIYKAPYNDLLKINDSLHLLKELKQRGPTSNSDHYFFYTNHVPCFFIYTMGGIKAYHDIYDRRETLPLTNFDDVFHLLIHFTDDICNRRF